MIKISPDWELLCKIMGTEDPTEIQLELRQSIVQEFTRRYLKGVVATEQFEACVAEIKRAIKQEFDTALSHILINEDPRGFWSVPRFSLKPDFKLLITQEIESSIKGMVLEVMREKLKVIDEDVKSQLERLEDWKQRHIQEVVKETITKTVSETAQHFISKKEECV